MEYIFFFFEFILAIFFAFYIPGRVFLGKTEFPFFVKIAVAIIIGIVLWAMQGLLFGYLHIRWASYVYLVIFFGIFLKNRYFKDIFQKRKITVDIPAFLIIAVGVIGQVLPYFRMGIKTAQGIVIVASNPDDHVWHAALVKELVTRFPPQEPSIAGIPLKDYHYLYNLVTADLIRVFHLPFFATQFDGMYILAPILLGVLAYGIVQGIKNSKLFVRLSLFLIFFAGDAAGWIMLIQRHVFVWNLQSLIIDATKFVDSPPYAFAMLSGLAGFYILFSLKGKLTNLIVVALVLLFGCLLEFKVHVGIPFLFAFGIYALWQLLRKNIQPFIAFFFAGILAFVLLKLGSSSTAGLIFLPVDIPRDFINQSVLQLQDWQFRWIIYQKHQNIIRLIQYGAMMTGFYLLAQFGILLLGLTPFIKTIRQLGVDIMLFLYTLITTSFILGLFFYQTVGGANIWEFFLTAFIPLCLLTALSITFLLEKQKLFIKIFVILLVGIIVSPQWFISSRAHFAEQFLKGFYGVSNDHLASFEYLNTHTPQHTVIFLANQKSYAYASVVNLFVNRDLYLSGNGVRQIITPEIAKRREEVATVSFGTNSPKIGQVLRGEHINYVYFYGKPKYPSFLKHANLQVVFSNKNDTIFQVQ